MENRKQHIVFLTPGFAGSESDTTTVPALQDYLKLIRGHLPDARMTLLAFQFPFSYKAYDWTGIDVIPLNGRNRKFGRLLVWQKAWRHLQKLHQEQDITVIHSFWIGECSWIGQRFSNSKKIKHVATAMGQDVFKNRYARFLNPDKSKIVTLSQNQHKLLLKNYGLESEIIPWSVPTKIFPQIQETTVDILGVGSLNSIKNYGVFLEIVASAAKSYPNLKVEIIGEGGACHRIQKDIANRNLANIVTLTGKQSREQVLEKMSQAKILLHTSTYESFGYVFAEALYSGMKIVSFDVGAAESIPEWMTVNSTDAMIAACLSFLTSENTKKRVLLNAQTETLNPYLKFYNE